MKPIKDNDMEHIWTHIKKGYEPEEWVHQTINLYLRKNTEDNTYIIVEISLHLSIENEEGVIEAKPLSVTTEYIGNFGRG